MEEDRHDVNAGPWAAFLHRAHAPAAASLRTRADVLACVVDDVLWLRGPAMDAPSDAALRCLAPHARYVVSDTGELTPMGNVLPTRRLPDVEWVPLSQLTVIDRPAAALPSRSVPRVSLRLVRSADPRPATHLLVSLADFARYAHAAPGVRLRPLRFAATSDEVLIAGSPLPPVPGVACWESSGVIVPCGWVCFPMVDAATVRRVLALQSDELALFRVDGTYHLLHESSFVAARRSAVRATAARGADA